jgi:hypothetical protein
MASVQVHICINIKRLSTDHVQRTYRKNGINVEQNPNEWDENAHGDFGERYTDILDEYITM